MRLITGRAKLSNPRAPAAYAVEAREGATRVADRLSPEGKAVLERAQNEARLADDNHVGTEHIVLGILALEESVGARALKKLGITRDVLVAQRYEEEGHSPAGPIPRTPRANRILVLAAEASDVRGDSSVASAHLLLGAVAESEEWQASGRGGPHHLRDAAAAVGKTLEDVRRAVD